MSTPKSMLIPTQSKQPVFVNASIFPHFLIVCFRCFLLIQAYLEKARLPISDYINDTKTVVDNVPRLLAAMQAIAIHGGLTAGFFEVVTQICRTKQLIETRSTVRL